MRHAFGKPAGTVARVSIGQPLISVRCKDGAQAAVQEALRRAKYKIAGRQIIVQSAMHGFTHIPKEEFKTLLEKNELSIIGNYAELPTKKRPQQFPKSKK